MKKLPPHAERTVAHVLRKNAKAFGDKPAIKTTDGQALTYEELDAASNRIAHGLDALGVDQQEPVLIMMPDTIDFVLLWCGLAKRGAIEVPVNLAYRGTILAHICNDSQASTIIIDQQFLDRLEEIEPDLKYLKRCIVYSDKHDIDDTRALAPKLADRCHMLQFHDLHSENEDEFQTLPSFHELVGIMYTSGTTGASKGVMVTHAHSYIYAYNCSRAYEPTENDVFYTAGLPLFHVAGQWAVCYAAFIHGSTIVLRNGYKNEHFWPDVRKYGCTVVLLLGVIGNFLWKLPEQDEDSDNTLRTVFMVPVIPDHEAFCKRFGVKVSTAYGSTENPGLCVHPPGEPFTDIKSVGFPVEDFEVCIFDELDQEVETGTIGEICVRPRYSWDMIQGYWKRPVDTLEAFRNFWYHTGDTGYKDGRGRFYFVDRKTDSLRRRGENISATEVEHEIRQHSHVQECAVIPVWDENTEQEIMTVITPKPGSKIDPAELTNFLNDRMPYFMIPRYIDFDAQLPKTSTGKIQKYPLRDRGITPTTWDRVEAGVKLRR